jgi:hypothetical protein
LGFSIHTEGRFTPWEWTDNLKRSGHLGSQNNILEARIRRHHHGCWLGCYSWAFCFGIVSLRSYIVWAESRVLLLAGWIARDTQYSGLFFLSYVLAPPVHVVARFVTAQR